jgi:hypothetical protein
MKGATSRRIVPHRGHPRLAARGAGVCRESAVHHLSRDTIKRSVLEELGMSKSEQSHILQDFPEGVDMSIGDVQDSSDTKSQYDFGSGLNKKL